MQSGSTVPRVQTEHLIRSAATERFRLSERAYPPHTQSPLHAHVKSYIIIPISAGYSSTFGRQTSQFMPWSVSFHPAGLEHTSRYPAQGARVLYAEIQKAGLGTAGELLPSKPANLVKQNPRIEQMARHLYQEFTSPDEYSSLVIESVLLQMLTVFGRERKHSVPKPPNWLAAADSIIEARFAESLQLADIASEIGVHPGHLAREFRRYKQCTVGERIRSVRFNFASQQLAETDLSLASIAQAAGYTDQSHLTTAFKVQLGITPAAYRRARKSC